MILIRIKLLLTAFFWGGTFIAGRIIARNIDPFTAAFWRFAIASLFLVIILWKMEGRFPRLTLKQSLPIVLLGLSGIFAYNVFFFNGLHYVTAGRAALIIANNPVFISLFSAFFFKEKLSLLKIGGILCSVSGAILVISRGNWNTLLTGEFGIGEFYILLCVATWVIYSLVGKAVMIHLSPLVAVTYSCIIGTVALFFPTLMKGGFAHTTFISIEQWGSLFYLGFFGTVLGFMWYYQGIRAIGPMKASIFINFVPISAVLLAFLILKESLTASLLLGTALVTGGVYLTNFSTLKLKQWHQKILATTSGKISDNSDQTPKSR
ncbi:MAG: DMT family transporter [Calditrichia bacterium]